jgi:hypothetical protein
MVVMGELQELQVLLGQLLQPLQRAQVALAAVVVAEAVL